MHNEGILGYMLSFMGFLNWAICLILLIIVIMGYDLYYSNYDGDTVLKNNYFVVILNFSKIELNFNSQ